MKVHNTLFSCMPLLPEVRGRNRRTFLFICLAGCIIAFAALRIPLLGSNLFQNGWIDEKNAVDSAGSLLARRTLEGPGYAWGHLSFYINALAFALSYAYMRIAGLIGLGDVKSASDFAFIYLVKPHIFLCIGRLVAMLFSAAICALAFRCAQRITGSIQWAACALLLSVLDPVSCRLSAQALPETMMAAFGLAAILASLRIIENRAISNYIAAGCFVGMAAATKYNGILVALAPCAAHVLGEWKTAGIMRHMRRLAIIIASIAAAFALCMPYAIIRFDELANRGIIYQLLRAQGPSLITPLQTIRNFITFVVHLNPPLTCAGFASLGWAVFKKDRYAIVLAAAVAPFCVVFSLSATIMDRYIIVLFPVFILAITRAGFLISRQSGFAQKAVAGIVLTCILWATIISARQIYFRTGMSKHDYAAQWIESNIDSGAKITLDTWYGPTLVSPLALGLTGKRKALYPQNLISRLENYLDERKHYNAVALEDEIQLYDPHLRAVEYLQSRGFEYVIISPWYYLRFYDKKDAGWKWTDYVYKDKAESYRRFFSTFFQDSIRCVYSSPDTVRNIYAPVEIYALSTPDSSDEMQ